jgi:tetratricopeptide (TPR) repeat protein
MAQMTSRYRLGDLVGSEHYFERGRAFFDNEVFKRGRGAVPQTFGNASQVAFLMGNANAARNRMLHAIASARENQSPYDDAFAQFMDAMLHLFLREPEEAEQSAALSLRLSEEHKFPQFAAISRIALGRACAELRDARRGVELIRQGMAEMLATRNRTAIGVYLHWLSEGQIFIGQIEEATSSIEEALNDNLADRFFRPENLRLRGELWLKQGNPKLAEKGVREAIEFAHKIEAKTSELRAATCLARLLAEQGRRAEAHAMLMEIYCWFSEGLDTRSLTEARNFLTESGSTINE